MVLIHSWAVPVHVGQRITLHMHSFIECPFLELDLFTAEPLTGKLQILKKELGKNKQR